MSKLQELFKKYERLSSQLYHMTSLAKRNDPGAWRCLRRVIAQ